MADSDTRLETLEDEVKVLKGEVKRTLVDLRALLMRENSPLGEASFARRSAAQGANNPPVEPRVIEVTAVTAPPPSPAPQPAAEQAAVASAVPVAQVPPWAGPAPQTVMGAGPAFFPPPTPPQIMTPPAPAGPGPAPDLAGLVEQERRMADQERRIADQERRMLERERRINESDRRMEPRGRPGREVSFVEDEEEVAPAPRILRRRDSGGPVNRRMPLPVEIQEKEEEPSVQEPEPQDPWQAPEEPAPPASQKSWPPRRESPEQDRRETVFYPDSPREPEREKPEAGDEEDGDSALESSGGRRASVYDEYWDLMERAETAPAPEETPAGPALDVNLLSSLVRWASLAKQRVGEEQLKEILELYIQSGHSRPELQQLLLRVSGMVEEPAIEAADRREDWVDLMFHLHGILTGGLPVTAVRPMSFPAKSAAKGEGAS